MQTPLQRLEQKQIDLVRAFTILGDLCPGSTAALVRHCGKPICHCARPDDSSDGPCLRLTCKRHGKTMSEALPAPVDVRKAEQEIAVFRKFHQISRVSVEVNGQLCRLRPVEESLPAQEKERLKRFSGKSCKK